MNILNVIPYPCIFSSISQFYPNFIESQSLVVSKRIWLDFLKNGIKIRNFKALLYGDISMVTTLFYSELFSDFRLVSFCCCVTFVVIACG